MALSTICFVLMQLSYKQLTKHFNPFLTLGLRACFLCIFNLILMGRVGVTPEVKDPISNHFNEKKFLGCWFEDHWLVILQLQCTSVLSSIYR